MERFACCLLVYTHCSFIFARCRCCWWIVFVVWLTDEIANFRNAASRIWACTEPEFRLCWIKLCSNDNRYTTAPLITFYTVLVTFCSLLVTFYSLLVTLYSLVATLCSLLVIFSLLLVTFYLVGPREILKHLHSGYI